MFTLKSATTSPKNNECSLQNNASSHEYLYLEKQPRLPVISFLFLFESVVTEQLTTCCCFYRQICHGDGCHPGHLSGASHPCSEDGRPLQARRASQTDVEAGGRGPAAGAGPNAEQLMEMLHFMVAG